MSVYLWPPVSVSTQSSPTEFIRDLSNTQVKEDTTTPANNRPFPSKIFIQKDGTTYPVNKDTGTPANTVAIPVEIVQASGTSINITAGDINVQLTHLGANADSTRIGDGVTELGIKPVTKEALVHDADVKAAIDAIAAQNIAVATSFQSLTIDNLTAQTITPPVGCKWIKIHADDDNNSNLKVVFGGTVATSTIGEKFAPGRSEDYQAVSSISVIAQTASTNQGIYLTYGV